jgi:arylsulfatase A-like enzyme/Flp pilus assembly protein TadD
MTATSTRAGLAAAAVLAIAAGGWMLYGRHRGGSFERRADQNILLVTIDTLRTDALSSYGGRSARTPTLDGLAARGVLFDFAHAHAVLTRPSHASILTGLYPYQHGVRDHSGYRVRPGTPTLATLLKAAGFATGAFVGGVPLERQFGLDAGFDVYDDNFARAGGDSDFALAERPAGAVVDAALRWTSRQPGRWFAWVHVFDPHAPYAPPPPFDKEYAGNPYYGEVAYVDQALQPLLDAVAHATRPATVVVTGDHGEGLGDHGELTHGLFAYESTLHVPLILAQLPPRGTTGTVSRASARHIDIVPTLLDAAAVAMPTNLPGHSLLPGAAAVDDRDVTSYFEAMSAMLNRGWAPLQGVVAGREKYVDLPVPEIYDLAKDPGEGTNLADRLPDRRRALEARLLDFHAAPPGARATETPEVAAKLQSLGYTSGSAARKAKYSDDDDPKRLVQLDRWIQQGIEAWQQNRRDEALDIYRRVVAARPSMAIGYKNLAFLQWQSGDAPGAIATLERAFKANATEPSMTTQLGTYLAEAGTPADAIALLSPLASQSPVDPEVLNALGTAYARSGNSAQAAAAFQHALNEAPTNVQALENLATLEMQRGDATAAERMLRRAVDLNPKSARAHNGLGVLAMKAGRRDEAFAEWKQAVTLAPHDYDALFNLAIELDAAGRHEEARPYLQRFAVEAPASQYAADVARVRRMLQK